MNQGVLSEFIGLLTGGVKEMITGLASGLNQGISALFLNGDGALSTFAGFVAIMAGISLAVGFSYLVFRMIKTLGH